MIDIETVVTIVTAMAGGSGIAGIVVAINARKKSKADAVKVLEEATASLIKHYKDDNEAVRRECHELKAEVETLTCRLDQDVDECRREINGLQKKVATLEEKNKKLLDAIFRLVWQIKSKGDVPVVQEKELEGWAE